MRGLEDKGRKRRREGKEEKEGMIDQRRRGKEEIDWKGRIDLKKRRGIEDEKKEEKRKENRRKSIE